jgi:hypothetical protein
VQQFQSATLPPSTDGLAAHAAADGGHHLVRRLLAARLAVQRGAEVVDHDLGARLGQRQRRCRARRRARRR